MYKEHLLFLFILCMTCFSISLLLNIFYNIVFSDKGTGKFLYSAVSNPQSCMLLKTYSLRKQRSDRSNVCSCKEIHTDAHIFH